MGLASDCAHPERGALPGQHSGHSHGTVRASLSICGTHGLSAGQQQVLSQSRSLENSTFPNPAPPTTAYPCVRGSSHCVVRVLWFT